MQTHRYKCIYKFIQTDRLTRMEISRKRKDRLRQTKYYLAKPSSKIYILNGSYEVTATYIRQSNL